MENTDRLRALYRIGGIVRLNELYGMVKEVCDDGKICVAWDDDTESFVEESTEGLYRLVKMLHVCYMKAPRVIFVDEEDMLSNLQKCVDGCIEPLAVFDNNVFIYCNEDGIGTQPPNRAIYADAYMEKQGFLSQIEGLTPVKENELYAILFGDFVVTKAYEDVEVDLSGEEIKQYTKRFEDKFSAIREVEKILSK